MNLRYAIRVSASALLLIPAAMLPVAIFAAVDSPREGWAACEALGTSVILSLAGAGGLWFVARPRHDTFGRREAYLMVGLTWLLAPVLAGLPFFLWSQAFHKASFDSHPFQSVVNCYFEATSGLTTTGASILPDIEAVPRGLLLWRSATHWLGGLGIVLLFVAVLPMVGAGGRKLHFVESTGPSPEGYRPRIRDTARILWMSYCLLTILAALALRMAGLPWFNAVCETFGAIATGGFSVRNASIAAYQSGLVEAIVVVVMVLGAVNFSLYFAIARGRWGEVAADPELRLMLVLIGTGSLLVVLAIHGTGLTTISGESVNAVGVNAIRYGIFNYVSMQTDTGFATADFGRWPFLAAAVIAGGTLIGGCAGSTTGGIKVIRLLAAGKILLFELRSFVRPRVVRVVRIGRRVLEPEEQLSILLTVLLFLLALAGGTLTMVLIGSPKEPMDVVTAFSASLASLCTAGPGFGGVGPAQNYLWLSDAGKLILCFLMLIGRLEIVPVLALFHVRFWRDL